MSERHISTRRLGAPVLTLATSLVAGILAAAGVAWLWREYTLYAVAVSAFSLLGGSLFMPRQNSIRIVLVGIGAGLLVGSLLALHGA